MNLDITPEERDCALTWLNQIQFTLDAIEPARALATLRAKLLALNPNPGSEG